MTILIILFLVTMLLACLLIMTINNDEDKFKCIWIGFFMICATQFAITILERLKIIE